MPSLVDHFRPGVHEAPITAAAHDPASGAVATADAEGTVAVQRPGEATPQLVFRPGGPVMGALALVRGGSLVAVGDEEGTVGVYRTDTGEAVFLERREGARGRVRAMRGLALSPDGARLAAVAKDGLLRVWDLTRGEREAWRGFSGRSVEFDPRGQRVLALDADGQPQLLDLMSVQAVPLDHLQTPAERAHFTPDGSLIVAAGPAGVSLLRVADGALVASFATRGGSGIVNIVLSPDGRRAAAITHRSVHVFRLPELAPEESRHHGAPDTSGAAVWTRAGVRVGGADGLMHGGGGRSAGPVVAVGGFGEVRLAGHGDRVALWRGDRRELEIAVPEAPREVHVDRDGRIVVVVPRRGPVLVYNALDGRRIMDGGPETEGAASVAVGGGVVAVQLRSGGCRWWDLVRNRGFQLRWPRAMALTHGGTWLGVVTPRGVVRLIDPANGREAMAAPLPLADVPVRLLAFVNRRPDLIVLDEDGVLGVYDLTASARGGGPAEGRDVLRFHEEVDRIWGITGGRHAAVRLPEGDRCSILWVDLHAAEVVHEVTDLHPDAEVDPENGLILEPAAGAAVLERGRDGAERRVLRALPGGEWICFDARGIRDASEGAAAAM